VIANRGFYFRHPRGGPGNQFTGLFLSALKFWESPAMARKDLELSKYSSNIVRRPPSVVVRDDPHALHPPTVENDNLVTIAWIESN